MDKIINSFDSNNLKLSFESAKPFPYVVIDNFFVPEFFECISKELNVYYEQNKKLGVEYQSSTENNKWGSMGLALPKYLGMANETLTSKKFRNFLSQITGFTDLEATQETNNSGYSFFHVMRPNSFLGPHTDHTVDMGNDKIRYHVLNIIVYMQDEWNSNWGGGTSIYKANKSLGTDIEYRPNRALVFMHSPFSIHGTQHVTEFAKKNRLSLYFDYYSNKSNPYSHLNTPRVVKISSPHRFFLDNVLDYFKNENKKYLYSHLNHYKSVLKNLLNFKDD